MYCLVEPDRCCCDEAGLVEYVCVAAVEVGEPGAFWRLLLVVVQVIPLLVEAGRSAERADGANPRTAIKGAADDNSNRTLSCFIFGPMV